MDDRIREKIVDSIAFTYLNGGCSRDEYVEMLTEMREFYEGGDARIDLLMGDNWNGDANGDGNG